jgi:hypothetical protein
VSRTILALRGTRWLGDLFAIILLNASIIGAAAVTLASSYAVGDLGIASTGAQRTTSRRQGFLQRLRRDCWWSPASWCCCLTHRSGLITLAVQAMCGLMLPSTSIFVLLLANDREALGPWVNARWLNVAVVIIAILVVLSVTMMVSTLFTSVNVVAMLEWLGAVVGSASSSDCPLDCDRQGPRRSRTTSIVSTGACRDWPCSSRPNVAWRASGYLMRNWYLLAVAGTLLVVRIIQLATS